MTAVLRDCFDHGAPPAAGKAGAIVELLPIGRTGEAGFFGRSLGTDSYAAP